MYLEDSDILRALPGQLLPWYEENRRELPWRADRDPYHIWVSEIMLQQTRVEAVKGYYARFLEHLPTVTALAHAEDALLHKLWEGLGYYSRVRNLKKAALVIEAQHGGRFPYTYEEIRALPGIGPYTAGAIASIAFGLPEPAVDGNVLRVLSRLLAWQEPIDLPRIKALAQRELAAVYPQDRPGDFTQALMELGATVCGPNGVPQCDRCPMASLCRANAAGTQTRYPLRLPKKARRQEERTVLVLCCRGEYALEKRPDEGLLAGLWQFPNVEGALDEAGAVALAESWGLAPRDIRRRVDRTHIFTHIQWNLRAYRLDCDSQNETFTWLTRAEIEKTAALPTAFRQFLDLLDS